MAEAESTPGGAASLVCGAAAAVLAGTSALAGRALGLKVA
jgi:hypothetical protein